jgi:hypothetical protein
MPYVMNKVHLIASFFHLNIVELNLQSLDLGQEFYESVILHHLKTRLGMNILHSRPALRKEGSKIEIPFHKNNQLSKIKFLVKTTSKYIWN